MRLGVGLLIVCGPQGAGKTTCSDAALAPGVIVGDGSTVVRQRYRASGSNTEGLATFVLSAWREWGPTTFVAEAIEQLTRQQRPASPFLYVGCRHPAEVEYPQRVFSETLVLGIFSDVTECFRR
jgi:hypothetical protein